MTRFYKYVTYGAIALATLGATLFGFTVKNQPASHTTADTSRVQVDYTTQVLPHAYGLKKNAKLYTDVHLTKAVSAKPYLKSTWYRTEEADLTLNGKTRKIFRVTNTEQTHTFWVAKSQLMGISSKSYNVKLKAAKSHFLGQKIGVLGDSIPAGWDGFHFYAHSSFPDWVAKYLGTGTSVYNFACPSARIVGNRWAYLGTTHVPQDLSAVIADKKNQIKKMNIIFIQIGTNDYTNYSGSGSLTNVISHLRHNLATVQKLNPNAQIYGILPISRYDANGRNRQNMRDMYGYTYGQLRYEEQKLYRARGVKVINFQKIAPNIITDQNKNVTLEDHEIHPTAETAQKLGYALAKALAE
ncbi:SGNH/GDSL hydrolase family protein [Lentilactobacillus sunkii]|uniref:G-D-S-L family lipolytic protein n=1 Tax=Lentilactobacillus sunkii DSM 19904 TaxID=1423808 RepID=A0A0R1L0X6_9LACO|nr:SGNH/GDSL hydrolase family protein [Lentilactobacillus sunkii]KRK89467.1 G-D-S-L family lipolytic protein [Lentilactobacillus sunkii DSM 19904]